MSRRRSVGVGLIALASLPLLLHFALRHWVHPAPPKLSPYRVEPVAHSGRTRTSGTSQAVSFPGLNVVRLSGTPEQIGARHAALLRQSMIETERRFLARFQDYVPHAFTRALLTDLAMLRFFDLDRGITEPRRREIAAEAAEFSADPFASDIPTYQRFIYLNSLYDISLSFEHSPLLGCTTFFASGPSVQDGHTLFARNFDFEVDPVFDEQKTVFVVKEEGQIPYISISWPGLIGSVTGVNQKGLTLVVHGGRAGNLVRRGEPVLHILRDVLGRAETVEEAYRELILHPIMVSHIIVMADPTGKAQVVERVPGLPPYRYNLTNRATVTNHLVGPGASDPKNLEVMARTSTLERQQRGMQLLSSASRPLTVRDFIAFLRDRHSVNGGALPLGDRRAIGALIAAHGVALDLTLRELWVGGTPTLLGPYYRLRLDALFDDNVPLEKLLGEADVIAEDPLLKSTEYADYLRVQRR